MPSHVDCPGEELYRKRLSSGNIRPLEMSQVILTGRWQGRGWFLPFYLSRMVAQNMSWPPLPPTFTLQAGKGNRFDVSHPLKPGFL